MCRNNNKYGNEAAKIFGNATEQEEHSCGAQNACEVGAFMQLQRKCRSRIVENDGTEMAKLFAAVQVADGSWGRGGVGGTGTGDPAAAPRGGEESGRKQHHAQATISSSFTRPVLRRSDLTPAAAVASIARPHRPRGQRVQLDPPFPALGPYAGLALRCSDGGEGGRGVRPDSSIGSLHRQPTAHDPLVAPREWLRKQPPSLEWLDKQPPSSAHYISFGTTSSLRAEQVRELAAALRDTKQRFVWALRDADRADMREPGGERRLAASAASLLGDAAAQGTGVVVTGWAPQLEILAHGATAAFMSHCGWNSTVEGLSHGKAILAWPMHSDQPWDAELVCKYLRAGILVRPWEERGDVTPAAAIREAIERAMRSDEGTAVRERARMLGDAVCAAHGNGGSSSRDMDDLVAYVTR
ncbi:cis-zeatin O-glucosyltransferase 1-like [Lolium rigidum]|uniref:cis-zeatin O-glucosyltransferase 1-like n=1 Tax=Lolium rigidum TaxID=89674 RepID=UPI001F5E357E|nr:cis-zeatin O-glucosyltransferase 1-like [Lolium rigidum]